MANNFITLACPNCGGKIQRAKDDVDTFVCGNCGYEHILREQKTKIYIPQPILKQTTGTSAMGLMGAILMVSVCVVFIVIAALTIIVPVAQSVNEQVLEGSGYAGGADEILQANTMEGVLAYESSQYNCADVSLVSGEISAAPDAAGVWAELWQVNACGASHNFAITFTPTADGGTDYAITLAE